jgi:AhpD family alkylhydroperoxidase
MRLKEKELIAVGISVAAGCKPCTDYHVKAVRAAKATDDEIRQAIADAMCVRKSALELMDAYALSHLGATNSVADCGSTDTNRIKELVAIGAAFAVNCTTNLEKHVAAAEAVGITKDEVHAVVKLAEFIKGKAAAHVEKLVKVDGDGGEAQPRKQAAAGGCGCGRSAATARSHLAPSKNLSKKGGSSHVLRI